MPWQRSYEMALAAQSRLWGGTGDLILPATDDIADNELFWALADRVDADYFGSAALHVARPLRTKPRLVR